MYIYMTLNSNIYINSGSTTENEQNNETIGTKKFYKLNGLSDSFETEIVKIIDEYKPVFTGNISESANIPNDVGEQTIFFITANEKDASKYIKITYPYSVPPVGDEIIDNNGIIDNNLDKITQNYNFISNGSVNDNILLPDEFIPVAYNTKYIQIDSGDTLLWVKGDFYALSSNSVKNIIEDNNFIIITFSDGTTRKISKSANNYSASYPIVITDGAIGLTGLTIDGDRKNIYEFDNSVAYLVKNSHVEGVGNEATANYQHIQGKYSKADENSIFIIGGGTDADNRKNLFTVGFNGVVNASNDIISNINGKQYKLSNIHSITDDDWVNVGYSNK